MQSTATPPIGVGRRAFTLIEILTVIAIVGVLMAMLLPAIQSARESARRASCSNTIKQIGVALSGYESTAGRFPPGVGSFVWQSRERVSGAIDDRARFGFYQWTYFLHVLLPRLEEQDYFDLLGGPLFRKQDFVTYDAPPAKRDWAVVSGIPLRPLLCPSDSLGGTNWLPRSAPTTSGPRPWAFDAQDMRLAKSNYLGFFSGTSVFQSLEFTTGTAPSHPREDRVAPLPKRISPAANKENPQFPLCERAVFGFGTGTPVQAVTDGASYTVAVGEYLRGATDHDARGLFWLNFAGMQMLQATTTPNSRTPDRLLNPRARDRNMIPQDDAAAVAATDYGCFTQTGDAVTSPNNRPASNLPCIGGDPEKVPPGKQITNRWAGWDGFAATRSRHRGGVNVLFVDGHVSFINDSIDGSTTPPYGTWQRLVWIDDGNPVDEW